MLSLKPLPFQTSFCSTQNAVDGAHPLFFHPGIFQYNPWLPTVKEPTVSTAERPLERRPTDPAISIRSALPSPSDSALKLPRTECQQDVCSKQELTSDSISCKGSGNLMNGADDFRMTGSSNPRADQLNWLADVAIGGSRGPQNHSPSAQNNDKVAASRPPMLQNPEALTPRSSYGSILLGASPLSQRMYASQYHLEQHFHPTSGAGGAGLSLYYSQAPRSAQYSNFYQTDHRLPPGVVADGLVNQPGLPRPYFQGELYSPTMTSIANVQLPNAHAQLPHSPSYLHQTAALSPVGLSVSPSSPHSRTPLQTGNIVISRSPKELPSQDRDKGHMPHQGPCNSPQFHQEDRKQSYKSPEPKNQSPIGDGLQSSACQYVSEFGVSKDLPRRQNASPPSHVAYKVPTGKEGSLKHRILRPPSINIVDPPSSILDAPLSAPPIRSHRDPSPKHLRQDSYGGYRSFSTSGSFVLDGAPMHVAPQMSAPSSSFVVPTCTLSSSSLASAPAPQCAPDCAPQLKYPPAFMKGSIIQLANSQLKPVEQMTTEDFMECEALSPNLKIDSSTVICIEKMPATGSAKLGFSVGEKKFQITVEAPLEHPFFVYKQGWSSCCPERSLLRYGLTCHKLKVGDTCIFLTVKSELSSGSRKPVLSPKLPSLVPMDILTSAAAKKPDAETLPGGGVKSPISRSSNYSTCNSMAEKTKVCFQKEEPSVVPFQQKVSLLLSPEKTDSNVSCNPPRKRKRRWSFPGRISVGSPSSSSSS